MIPVQVLVNGTLQPFTLRFGYDENGHRNLVTNSFGDREESLYSPEGELRRNDPAANAFNPRLRGPAQSPHSDSRWRARPPIMFHVEIAVM